MTGVNFVPAGLLDGFRIKWKWAAVSEEGSQI
jgi:hypothetical protein